MTEIQSTGRQMSTANENAKLTKLTTLLHIDFSGFIFSSLSRLQQKKTAKKKEEGEKSVNENYVFGVKLT